MSDMRIRDLRWNFWNVPRLVLLSLLPAMCVTGFFLADVDTPAASVVLLGVCVGGLAFAVLVAPLRTSFDVRADGVHVRNPWRSYRIARETITAAHLELPGGLPEPILVLTVSAERAIAREVRVYAVPLQRFESALVAIDPQLLNDWEDAVKEGAPLFFTPTIWSWFAARFQANGDDGSRAVDEQQQRHIPPQ